MSLVNLSKFLIKYDNLKTIKVINIKLWILAWYDMGQLWDNHYSVSSIFRVMPLFNLEFLSKLLINLKTIKDINMKLWILAYHYIVLLQGKVHNFESYIFVLYPFQLNILSRMMASDRRVLVPHAVLLFA